VVAACKEDTEHGFLVVSFSHRHNLVTHCCIYVSQMTTYMFRLSQSVPSFIHDPASAL